MHVISISPSRSSIRLQISRDLTILRGSRFRVRVDRPDNAQSWHFGEIIRHADTCAGAAKKIPARPSNERPRFPCHRGFCPNLLTTSHSKAINIIESRRRGSSFPVTFLRMYRVLGPNSAAAHKVIPETNDPGATSPTLHAAWLPNSSHASGV